MRLQHATIPIPDRAQDQGRRFYRDVLALAEKVVPDSRADAGLVWFDAGPGELELHLAPRGSTARTRSGTAWSSSGSRAITGVS